ncbi:MAG: flagellar hook-length control protein FliK, partial [Aliarcobacter sp.]|nr:flagellar hook-length control protein FliK [Aliarcobacter sp.]
DDGNITMKKINEDKFYCQINLTLKDFGKVDLMLAMYDTNKIDLTIYAQREHFKTAIRDNMQKLKIALNNVDLIPVNIKLLDLKEEEKAPVQVYMENSYTQTINSNIDIRA